MPLNIKINNFEGPFDLLLHLIKKDKMDIYDIRISEIVEGYFDYINKMDQMDMEITSEFIVMAATLIEIKSKMLLPNYKDEEGTEEEIKEDPRKELVQKLIEYKKFKAVAEYLKSKFEGSGEVFSKKPEIIEIKEEKKSTAELLKNVDMLKLYNIYNDLMNNYLKKLNTDNLYGRNISIDKFKIEDKMKYIDENIKLGEKVPFEELIQSCENKMEVIVTFCALLELIKLKLVHAFQSSNFSEIYLERISMNETS